MSPVQALQAAIEIMDRSPDVLARVPTFLGQAIDMGLKPPAPPGSPERIRAQVQAYLNPWRAWLSAGEDLHGVATTALPTAWRGQTSENAVQAVKALENEALLADNAFAAVSGALQTWSDRLAYAQSSDEQGRFQLQQARDRLVAALRASFATSLSLATLIPILEMAAAGCHDRLSAAKDFESGASDAASVLNQWAAKARARQIATPSIDPLSRIVLAASAPEVLTPTALARGSQRLNGMSSSDRSAFEALLSGSKSPLEASELWKALAAGYSLADVQAFHDLIHPHGDDQGWLIQHLQPDIQPTVGSGKDTRHWLGYAGATGLPERVYSQGSEGDCVAASTVVARAYADPVFMLGLSTGQGPAAVGGAKAGEDSAAALQKRLQHTYLENQHSPPQDPAISPEGRMYLDHKLLAPSTGRDYEELSLTDRASRQAVMPRIEAAVNAGQPVPIGVYPPSGGIGHQVVIVRADGDHLEVYNPWGYTQSVTKQQFFEGQIGALTNESGSLTEGFSAPTFISLPK
ncbi:hypothetical protein ACFROC_19160 [Nocardia tengchongensis]|uniref:hypothetical protein n=1 Tax=Nocardia tengchongensis TaxID=2055889 RepID=UPI0036A1FB90